MIRPVLILVGIAALLFGALIYVDVTKSDVRSATGDSANIIEYKLEDGTRCAVLIGYNKGSIDCDWGYGKR